MAEATSLCPAGRIWSWAGNDDGSSDPDIVLACTGDVVTMEIIAAAEILLTRLPNLKLGWSTWST